MKSVVFVRDKLLRHQPERTVVFGQSFYLLDTSVESYDTRTVFFWQIAALIYVYYLYFLTLFKILLFSLCEGLTWLT